MKESEFQHDLISEINQRFGWAHNVMVLKTDPTYIQGFPDLLVLIDEKWFALECKKNKTAAKQPNQKWYVEFLNDMSFARFIYPENAEEVLNEIQQAL